MKSRLPSWIGLLIAFSLAATGRAEAGGLIINPTFNTTQIAADGFNVATVEASFNYAASQIEAQYSNNIHVNIEVTSGSTGLGMSNTQLSGPLTYAQVKTALSTTLATSADGPTILANLPASDPTGGGKFFLSTAEAKAVGLQADNTTAGSDGKFTFSNAQSYTFRTATNPNGPIAAGTYDFVSVAEHEISELMGRIALLGTDLKDNNGNVLYSNTYTADDLYRFTAQGTRSLNQTDTNAYLSIDNGATNLVNFNPPGNGDLGDYKGDTVDPFNAFTSSGTLANLTSADLINLEALGYIRNGANPTPEPATLLSGGLACLIGLGSSWRRRRQARAAA